MRFILLLSLACVVGCSSYPSNKESVAAMDAVNDTERAPASSGNHWEIRANSIMRKFDQAKFPIDKFPVSDEFIKDESITSLKESLCVASNEDECLSRVLNTLHSRLAAKYNLAKREDVNSSIEADPRFANSPRVIEVAYIYSHNFHVEEQRRVWIIQERKEADQMSRDANPLIINVIHQSN